METTDSRSRVLSVQLEHLEVCELGWLKPHQTILTQFVKAKRRQNNCSPHTNFPFQIYRSLFCTSFWTPLNGSIGTGVE